MIHRAVFLLALIAAILAPLFIERLGAAPALPPPPTLVSLGCNERTCTVVWELGEGERSGAALLSPEEGEILTDTLAGGQQTTRIERELWQPGQPLVVLEFGPGWERRTRWVPMLTHLPWAERS